MLSLAELEHVVAVTGPVLVGSRVRAVHDDGEATLYVTVRAPGRNLVLVLSIHEHGGRLALLDDTRPPAPPTPRAFTQQLRKQIVGGLVTGLTMPVPGDRFVALQIERLVRPDEDASAPDEPTETDDAAHSGAQTSTTTWTLLLALTGRAANLVLLDETATVRGALEGGRAPRIGTPWLADAQGPPPQRDGDALTDRFVDVTAGDGQDEALALGAAIDARLTAEIAEQETRARRTAMRAALRRSLKRARRRATAIAGDLERAEAADADRAHGDLLAANFTLLSRGMSSVTVDNFYDDMRPIEIALDPALEPRQNIDRYYARYKKFHRAIDGIRERLAEAEELQLELELLAEAVRDGDLDDDSLGERLHALGVAWQPERRQPTPRRRGAEPPTSTSDWRTFFSRNGTEIRVGKGARENDTLTFRASRGSDLWLHAAGWAGSHVLVRLERGEDVDPEALLDAATLAAHYSKARSGSVIEVQYTRQKHVRKARGAAPGLVYLSGHKTLAVRIEDARLRRLMASSSGASR